YSLIQEFEDIRYNKTYYQVHPLNRSYIKDEWWQKGEKERAHDIAAQYYLKKELTIDSLSKAVHHLRMAKKYKEMAELIVSSLHEMYLRGFWDESLAFYNLILDEKERIEKIFQGIAYNNIGLIYRDKGELDKALDYFLKAEKICIEVGNRVGLAFTYFSISANLLNKGDFEKARDYLILGGYIAMVCGMKHELSQMAWALEPIIKEI
ncbi:MAG: tetratricopeptide repeat protein, partial [Nitrospirae bacterium]